VSNVKVLIGDLFESTAQTLTNTVNTVGVMGKGIALGFKKRYPDMFEDYVRRCERGEVRLGQPYLFQPLFPPWILNFPTKEHWRAVTRLSDIEAGLAYLKDHVDDWGIESLAVPPLGCGEGQLEWRIVGPTLFRGLDQLGIPVELYAPFGTPHAELTPDFLYGGSIEEVPKSRVPLGALALAAIVERIAAERHHYPVGRTVFQKIAYFATIMGLPTGLQFERRSFGPYSDDVNRLKSRLINNGLLVEQKRGQMFQIQPGPTLADARRAYSEELANLTDGIERVADLFLRLERTRDAEVAASAHYMADQIQHERVARGGRRPSEDEIVERVLGWKARRREQLTEDEIVRAVRTLGFLDLIDAESPEVDELAVT
jgi:uncharacterized protein YwgA/O-acetyl-ADP-ribose deacetylase (regulator of RNase III)